MAIGKRVNPRAFDASQQHVVREVVTYLDKMSARSGLNLVHYATSAWRNTQTERVRLMKRQQELDKERAELDKKLGRLKK